MKFVGLLSKMIMMCAVFVGFLAGCAHNNISREYQLNQEKGLLVGSVTYYGNHGSYRVYARRLDNPNNEFNVSTKSGPRIPFVPATEMSSSGIHGDTFAIELEPGLYEFYSWHIYTNGLNLPAYYPFSVKVEVLPGKAIYVGNFYFHKKNGFMSSVTEAELRLMDRYRRDLGYINANYPNLGVIGRPENLTDALLLGVSRAHPVNVVFDIIFQAKGLGVATGSAVPN